MLFLIAILAPASALVVLATRIISQEHELAAKRAIDQRRAAVEQLRRELSAKLEAIRLEEINRMIRSPRSAPSEESPNPAVIFTATLDHDRLVLPWENRPAEDSPEFSRRLREAEAQEFIRKNAASAAAAYRAALAAAQNPSENANARLRLARTLSQSGNQAEADRVYHSLLNDLSGARDPEGVGYRFYAAERLLESKRDTPSVTAFLHRETASENRLTLPELYMLRTLLGPDPKLSERIADMELTIALAKDISRVRAQVENGAAWVPYGREPWLVTVTTAQLPLPGLVVAVSSSKIAPPGIQLLSRTTQGDPLGETLPGLHVEWSDNRLFDSPRRELPVTFWITGLALVLGIAVFGGYLLLRDVNRDVRMTEVRSQFVASVSHELKTPLTAIRMFAETLAMGRSRDERVRSEYLETIVNESERLARLVDNVLDFSKIEQGKKIYRLRPTRLDDVTGSAVRAMQFPLAQQGFKLHVSVDEEIPELQADPDAIQQAILNLLTNAMKYSGDARDIDLSVAARNGDVAIEVTDRGLGIAPEEQKHIFEKFYRVPSHESRLIAGTGLGLTLVAHIAKAHAGRVEVKSAPGEGSKFSILIPMGAKV